jgi:hypothetical protein
MAYLRTWQDEKILVLGSFSDHVETIDLSNFNLEQILLTNDKNISLQPIMHLSPYYAAIIKLGGQHAND